VSESTLEGFAGHLQQSIGQRDPVELVRYSSRPVNRSQRLHLYVFPEISLLISFQDARFW